MLIRQDCAAEQKNLMKSVEDIINEQIFGTYGCRSNWKFPVNDDGSMGQIKFAYWRARRIVENLDIIVDFCLPGDHRASERNQWKDCVLVYWSTIKVSLHVLLLYILLLLYSTHRYLLFFYLFFRPCNKKRTSVLLKSMNFNAWQTILFLNGLI
jgi:hypothetical protein